MKVELMLSINEGIWQPTPIPIRTKMIPGHPVGSEGHVVALLPGNG